MTIANDPSSDVDADRRRLNQFFVDLEELLDWIVRYRTRLVPSDVADALPPAWVELQPSFEDVRSQLGKASFEELRTRGLTGSQLSLKLGAIEAERRAFEKYRRIVEEGNVFTRLLRRLTGASAAAAKSER